MGWPVDANAVSPIFPVDYIIVVLKKASVFIIILHCNNQNNLPMVASICIIPGLLFL